MRLLQKQTSWSMIAANAVVLLCLAAYGIITFYYTEGVWWIADPGPARWRWAGLVVLGYAGLCLVVALHTRFQNNTTRQLQISPLGAGGEEDTDSILITYASQTGFAQELACRTVEMLQHAGQQAFLAPLHQLDRQRLSQGGRILFVASTTGQGDPPDHAIPFVQKVMQQPALLHSLQYGILALGDRQYERYCAFGHQLNQWLRERSARPLFDIVEVDRSDENALNRWQTQVQKLGLIEDQKTVIDSRVRSELTESSWSEPKYSRWIIKERRELNSGSQGGKVYFLSLRPLDEDLLKWTPGDVVEILPCNCPQQVTEILEKFNLDESARIVAGVEELSYRELLMRSNLSDLLLQSAPDFLTTVPLLPRHLSRKYSIASVAEDGELHLVVRRVEFDNGQLGVCSGWLCDHAKVGESIELRIRTNPNFHPPENSRPLILIGNGTGIAGLRSHLKARATIPASRNWLVFGERNSHCDYYFKDDLEKWQVEGVLERVDLAFSRDQPERIYVQHKLRQAADELRRWVDGGASIYVCGSLQGMAPQVDRVLREELGDEFVNQMLRVGRYRRDVY